MSSTFDNCKMNFEFDYINLESGEKVFSRIPPRLGDILTGIGFDGVVYDYVIVKIDGNKYSCNILRVNRTFYSYVEQQYERYENGTNI